MSKSQRTKGAVFEREVGVLFSTAFKVDTPYKRNIGQARDGGCDIHVGPFKVECKRRASLKVLRMWMQQATVSAPCVPPHVCGSIPVVVMREDGGGEPMVLLNMSDFLTMARAFV
jgi:hypothetical protein